MRCIVLNEYDTKKGDPRGHPNFQIPVLPLLRRSLSEVEVRGLG